ncbi:hypothetical protein MRY82_09845 [bacterium]|nr:hypothetical protein [bacterium]
MKHCFYSLLIASTVVLNNSHGFAQSRFYQPNTLLAQGNFLVKPKNQSSRKNSKVNSLEQKAKARASQRYKARALSARLLSQKGRVYVFKVKLRKSGRIFSKTIEIRD